MLERAFKRKMTVEEKTSGIAADSIELDQIIESIIGRNKGAQTEN